MQTHELIKSLDRDLRQTGISRGDLRRIIETLSVQSDAWQIAGTTNIPFPQLIEILQRLASEAYIVFHNAAVHLTPKGKALAGELDIQVAPSHTCAQCDGSGFDLAPYAHAYKKFAPIVRERPPAISSFNQGALTTDSVFRRLALMDAQGDLRGKKVILLGDDDLTSLALALTGLPREIVVVEVDERLVGFIRRVARENNLTVRVEQYDVRNKLPAEFHGAFDTFITDPPETIQGLLLFVEKGLAMLAPGERHAGYFGITLIEASLHKWNLWQRHLLQNQAVVFTNISVPFSLYDRNPIGVGEDSPLASFAPFSYPPREPWYRSSFFRVETLSEFVPPPDYDTNPRDELYADAESMDEAWAKLAGLEPNSPVPLPEGFLQASRDRAQQASYGLGRHIIAEFWNCQNPNPLLGLERAVEHACTVARATLLDLNIRRFYPQGFSGIALLAESHISFHAWPELGYVALDVFTCGQADPQKILSELEAHFQPRETAYLKIPRGRVRTKAE